MVVCFWMITGGAGPLFRHAGFDSFYDAQADSIVQGHWNVPPEAILGEAFVIDGKYYGYFGFTPALYRIPLNALFHSKHNQWTGILMLFWVAAAIAAIIAFMDEFGISNPFLLLVAVVGSTLFFLCSFAIVYHEASITAASLALWAYFFFWRYLRRPGIFYLAAACLISFLSFFARLSVGAGPLILGSFLWVALVVRIFSNARWNPVERFLGWLKFPSPLNAQAHAAFLSCCLIATAATYLFVNHAKFGTWLDPAPYRYHIQYDAARLARIGGRFNHLSNIPFNLSVYFSPDRIHLDKRFPWFNLTGEKPGPGSAAKVDLIEGYTSATAGEPALVILSILGLASVAWRIAARRALPMMVAALLGGSLALTVAYVAGRYLHDFYPFLVISAIAGAAAIPSISNRPLRLALKCLVILAGIWSIAAFFVITLRYQSEGSWADPERHTAYRHLRDRVESWLPLAPAEPIRYNFGDKLEDIHAGQLLTVGDPPSTYRFDGEHWLHVSGAPLYDFRMTLKFPLGEPTERAPLWFAGTASAYDAVFIEYTDLARIRFCSDQTGGTLACGLIIGIEPGREYHLEIDADRLNSQLTGKVDGQTLFAGPMQFHNWKERDVLLGKSLVPSVHGREFTGEIRLR